MSNIRIYAASWLLDPATEQISGGAIAVRDGVIIARGTRDDMLRSLSAELVEYPGAAILPGFVNAHTHLELTHFPAWREQHGMEYSPRTFVDWIIQMVKINRGVTPEHARLSLHEGIRKCLQSGTTSVGDILTRYDLQTEYRQQAIGGRLYFEILGHDPARLNARLAEALHTIDTLHDTAITPALSPHAPYTIAEQFLGNIRTTATSHHLPLAIHISESAAETDFIYNSSGPIAELMYPYVGWQEHLTPPRHCSSTDLFDRHALLTPSTLAVHCVHLTLADARLLKERGVSICLCPRSNQRLDVGVAPVALFKKLGIPLALGTDSLASNDSLSLWDEIRFAHNQFADILTPAELLTMATSGGAAALAIADRAGSLVIGNRADFQIVELKGATEQNLAQRLVEQGTSAQVYLAGELL